MNIPASSMSPWVFPSVLAIGSGVAFTLVAVAYKLGQSRQVTPLQLMPIMAGAGVIFFGLKLDAAELQQAPAIVWVLGILAGLAQYACTKLFPAAMRMGPMSALWCAASLPFLPVIPYAWLAYGTKLSSLGYASLAAATACVAMASVASSPGKGSEESRSAARGRALVYCAVLTGVLLTNSLLYVSQWDLSQRGETTGNLLTRFGNLYMVLMYTSLAGSAVMELVCRRDARPQVRRIALGAIAGAGSVAGLLLLNVAAQTLSNSGQKESTIIYALSGAAGICTMAIVSAIFFAERRSASWYATIALGVLAVVLGNLRN